MSNIAQTNVYWDEDLGEQGAWAIRCYQPPRTVYQFDSYFAVQDFAMAMESGSQDQLMNIMASCFVNNTDPLNVVFHNLLEQSTSLMYDDVAIYTVEEAGDTLDDFLAEAGEELVDALLAGLKAALPDLQKGAKYLGNNPTAEQGMVLVRLARQKLLFAQTLEKPSEQVLLSTSLDFSMAWSNYTNSADFTLGWSCNVWLGNLIQTPTSDPNANIFLHPYKSQTLSWYQGFSTLVQEEVDGFVTITQSSGMIFGVQIHVPRQFFDVGTAPYYQIGQSNATGAGFTWTGDYTSDGYQFPNLPSNIGQIIVTPTASHSSLILTVSINPPTPKLAQN